MCSCARVCARVWLCMQGCAGQSHLLNKRVTGASVCSDKAQSPYPLVPGYPPCQITVGAGERKLGKGNFEDYRQGEV